VENTPSQLASRRVCAPRKEGVANQASKRFLTVELLFALVMALCVVAILGALLKYC
jgi:predicted nucleic acid-binding Zn ribbon protein